jgi:hypothetical protein
MKTRVNFFHWAFLIGKKNRERVYCGDKLEGGGYKEIHHGDRGIRARARESWGGSGIVV